MDYAAIEEKTAMGLKDLPKKLSIAPEDLHVEQDPVDPTLFSFVFKVDQATAERLLRGPGSVSMGVTVPEPLTQISMNLHVPEEASDVTQNIDSEDRSILAHNKYAGLDPPPFTRDELSQSRLDASQHDIFFQPGEAHPGPWVEEVCRLLRYFGPLTARGEPFDTVDRLLVGGKEAIQAVLITAMHQGALGKGRPKAEVLRAIMSWRFERAGVCYALKDFPAVLSLATEENATRIHATLSELRAYFEPIFTRDQLLLALEKAAVPGAFYVHQGVTFFVEAVALPLEDRTTAACVVVRSVPTGGFFLVPGSQWLAEAWEKQE